MWAIKQCQNVSTLLACLHTRLEEVATANKGEHRDAPQLLEFWWKEGFDEAIFHATNFIYLNVFAVTLVLPASGGQS